MDRDNITRGLDTDEGGGRPQVPVGKYYLFVVAVDQYDAKKGFEPLKTPVRDAGRLVELLLEKYSFDRPVAPPAPLAAYKGVTVVPYSTPEIMCLYNDRATKTAILTHLLSLRKVVTENDHLLIYFAGHGDNLPGLLGGYIMPFGADIGDPSTWMEHNNLYNFFGNYRANKTFRDILLILDCCCSGVVHGGLKMSDPDLQFSRYALTSAASREPVLDEALNGSSPFTDVLCRQLDANTNAKFFIEERAFIDAVEAQIEIMANMNSRLQNFSQTPAYGTLAESGNSRFIFRLKDPNVPPASVLSRSFIEYLNFESQKLALAREYARGKKEDLIIITTVCDRFNIHRIQGKALLEKLKPKRFFNFKDYWQIVVEPDKTGDGIWPVLAANVNIKLDENIKQQCAVYIRDRLKRRPDEEHRPLLFFLGCSFQSGDRSREIISFCKELQEELEKAKIALQEEGVVFSSVFVVVADTRQGGGVQFFKREDFVNVLGTDRNVIVADMVEALRPLLAGEWYDNAAKHIQSVNFQALNVDDYFDEEQSCHLEDFIVKVSEKLGVSREELANHLWH